VSAGWLVAGWRHTASCNITPSVCVSTRADKLGDVALRASDDGKPSGLDWMAERAAAAAAGQGRIHEHLLTHHIECVCVCMHMCVCISGEALDNIGAIQQLKRVGTRPIESTAAAVDC
jgi:hypothetical protein